MLSSFIPPCEAASLVKESVVIRSRAFIAVKNAVAERHSFQKCFGLASQKRSAAVLRDINGFGQVMCVCVGVCLQRLLTGARLYRAGFQLCMGTFQS